MRKPDKKRPGSRSGERTERGKKEPRSFSDRGSKPGGRSFSGKRDRDDDRRPPRDRDSRPDRAGRSERPSREGDSRPVRKPFRSGDRDAAPGGRTRKPGGAAFEDKPRRRFSDNEDRPRQKERDRDEKPARSRERSSDDSGSRFGDRPRRSSDRSFENKPRARFSDSDNRPRRKDGDGDRPGKSRERSGFGDFKGARGARSNENRRERDDRPRMRSAGDDTPRFKKEKKEGDALRRVKFNDFEDGKVFTEPRASDAKGKRPGKKSAPVKKQTEDGLIRLNKYLSNAGVASRREADTLIQSGVVKVNGVVVDQLGYKIKPTDKVTYGDEAVKSERKVYLLLNKPKDYITTTDDPQERKTVMELIEKACRERVYPVGRLDRNTTGLLLFTNDGELTTKLMHPKYRIKKVYHVSLNKSLKPEDFKTLAEGMELEDGPIKADDLAFVGEGKKEIGIEIHSGRNRIVRRMFEHLGYDVLKLDRVSFAGLTKKDLPRGKYRFLTAKEVAFLQMIG